MRKCKLFFRNIYIVMLLITGLALTYFIVVNGIALINTISSEQSKSAKEHSDGEKQAICDTGFNGQMTTEQSLKYENRVIDFYKTLSVSSGQLYIGGYYMCIAKTGIAKNAEIVWTDTSDFDRRLVSGRVPNEEEISSKKNVVIISKQLRKYTVQKDNSTQILLGNTYFSVIGVYETNDISEWRADMVLFKSTLSDEELNKAITCFMNNGIAALRYCGEGNNSGYNELFTTIQKNGFSVHENGMNEPSVEYNKKAKLNKMFMIVLFAFCIINCMVISNVWVQSRINELVIRKTMGYSMFQVEKMLFYDLAKYSIVAFGLALLLQIIYTNLTSGNTLKTEYIGINTIYIIFSMALVISISLIIPLIRVKNIIPARKIS